MYTIVDLRHSDFFRTEVSAHGPCRKQHIEKCVRWA